MMAKKMNFMEIAEGYRTGAILPNDERIKKAEELLAEMASTEDGRQEIAEIIGVYIDLNFNKFDIAPLLCNYRNFRLGEKPEFRLKKKGIRAYWIAPNSSTPKSRNYTETLGMEFECISVRPECSLDELKTGRIQSLAELMSDAQEALSNGIMAKVHTILAQVYNETNLPDNFIQDTTTLSQTSLDTALDYVYYKTGVKPVIIGDMMLTNQISKFTGYTDDIKTEIYRNGNLGSYKGCQILPLNEILNPATGDSIFTTNRLYIVSSKIGYAGTYGDAKSGQESSIEDWSWNARIDKEWGMCVTEPNGLYVIEVV